MIYCPYTDREITEEDATPEHIIPLALGGSNRFTIRVDSAANAKIGTEIDGRLAKDFLISQRRRDSAVKGHSRKLPEVVLKKTVMLPANRQVQLTLRGREKPTVWDSREQRVLSEEETAGQEFHSTITIPIFSRLQFVAKVALAAGFYIYGSEFRSNVLHSEVRPFLTASPNDCRDIVGSSKVRFYDQFMPPFEVDNQLWVAIDALCRSTNGSRILLMPGSSNLGISVGILGQHIGTINIPASTDSFPLGGSHDLGHVVNITSRVVERLSFREACKRLLDELPHDGEPSDSLGNSSG